MRGPETEHVLIVGVNRLAEVYVRAMTEFGGRDFSIVGLLANGTHMPGRLLQSYKVLGAAGRSPENCPGARGARHVA